MGSEIGKQRKKWLRSKAGESAQSASYRKSDGGLLQSGTTREEKK